MSRLDVGSIRKSKEMTFFHSLKSFAKTSWNDKQKVERKKSTHLFLTRRGSSFFLRLLRRRRRAAVFLENLYAVRVENHRRYLLIYAASENLIFLGRQGREGEVWKNGGGGGVGTKLSFGAFVAHCAPCILKRRMARDLLTTGSLVKLSFIQFFFLPHSTLVFLTSSSSTSEDDLTRLRGNR